MHNIFIDKRLISKKRYKNINENIIFEKFLDKSRKLVSNEDSLYVYLFKSSHDVKYKCSVETGFFSSCIHIDKNSLYDESIINTPYAQHIINSFEYEDDIFDLINKTGVGISKYKQPNNSIDWNGIVFASQNPTDRSVKSVTTPNDWYNKLKECAKYYGNLLLVKLHPWNATRGDAENKIRDICKPYKCIVDYFDHSCIKNCEHVVVGCSSFSIDCMLRGIPVKQLFRGYFHSCDAITFCNGDITKDIRTDIDVVKKGKQLTNFLANKYCFRIDCSYESWLDIIQSFYNERKNNNPFPLPQKHSYYAYLKGIL
jgi:hypothetical protein